MIIYANLYAFIYVCTFVCDLFLDEIVQRFKEIRPKFLITSIDQATRARSLISVSSRVLVCSSPVQRIHAAKLLGLSPSFLNRKSLLSAAPCLIIMTVSNHRS